MPPSRNNRQENPQKSAEIITLQLELLNDARNLVDLIELGAFAAANVLSGEIKAKTFKLKALNDLREMQTELCLSSRGPINATLGF
ncbi:MAG TPA: hypothetical protein VHF69_04705 [Candidatus Synoicihabitans sp.]|nr:hypothetical protein [Candidatus Synoicihabitans sp.]